MATTLAWCRCQSISRITRSFIIGFQKSVHKRFFNDMTVKEFTVPPYCNLDVDCPFNVRVGPLNPFDYPNQEKIIVGLMNVDEKDVHCVQDEGLVRLACKSTGKHNSSCLCIVQAPIKANINVNTDDGAVDVGSFENDFVKVTTTSGNIHLDPFKSSLISLASITGNIMLKTATQASAINLSTHSGIVSTGRLQALKLEIVTDTGDVFTESSYCNESNFQTATGNLQLQNVHMKCRVHVTDRGNVNIVRADGSLEMVLNEGTAEVILSRVTGDSVIHIQKDGYLVIKVLEECCNHTEFRIAAANYSIDEKFQVEENPKAGYVYLKPKLDVKNGVLVDCKKGTAKIVVADFMDIFKFTK